MEYAKDVVFLMRRAEMTEESTTRSNPDKVAIIAIVVTGITTLACILACAVVSIIFILNTPWQTF